MVGVTDPDSDSSVRHRSARCTLKGPPLAAVAMARASLCYTRTVAEIAKSNDDHRRKSVTQLQDEIRLTSLASCAG